MTQEKASNGNQDHPVWDVYNEYRTARLNVLYYTEMIHRLRDRNFWIEVTLAVAAPSSAIAGFGFFATDWGSVLWKILGGVAMVLAVLKPFLGLTDKIAKLEEIVAGYRALDHDLHRLEVEIHQDGNYTVDHRKDLTEALKKKELLVTQSQLLREDRKLAERCQEDVMKQLPASSFYIPPNGAQP